MELFKNTNFDFLGKKWPFIIASLVLTAAGLASLVAKGGPRWGIDFKGGALVYAKFTSAPNVEKIRQALAAKLGAAPEVQEIRGANEVIIGVDIRSERDLNSARQTIVDTLASTFSGGAPGKFDVNNIGSDNLAERLRLPLAQAGLSDADIRKAAQAIADFRNTPPQSGLLTNLDSLRSAPGVPPQAVEALKRDAFLGPYTIRNAEVVGPKIGQELRTQGIYVVLGALAGMLIYIAFRFEWIYGVAAVLAVFHDTMMTVGLFSLFDYEISLTVVAALLTLVGYSMNDTIVVFDRIRENLREGKMEKTFEGTVNAAVNQTLSRTVLTSGLTLLSALALLVFGGPVLHGFSFALVAGILVGTYSSVFVASPILIWWKEFAEKRAGAVQPGASASVKGPAPAGPAVKGPAKPPVPPAGRNKTAVKTK